MAIVIGTSGWQYGSWRGRFYPRDLAVKDWFDHYAAHFDTVEVNNTFYRMPPAERFDVWREQSPKGFVWAVKMSRFLTHVKRLGDTAPVDYFMERASHLGDCLGPVLVQLPPNLRRDDERLAAVLDAFPAGVRVAVEPRHESWDHDDVRALLAERDVALVLADRWSRPFGPVARTASWGYVRFHHGTADPVPCYGRTALRSWVERIGALWPRSADVFVYFNNDPEGCAPRDAIRFARLAAKAGWEVSAVPERLPPAG